MTALHRLNTFETLESPNEAMVSHFCRFERLQRLTKQWFHICKSMCGVVYIRGRGGDVMGISSWECLK